LDALAARQTNDIWAVGDFTADNQSMPASQPLIEHWDGHTWTIATGPHFKIPPPVGSPDPMTASAALYGIAIDPNGRPWAVGQQPTGHGANDKPLVEASCHPA
jgi:hypothetical protein